MWYVVQTLKGKERETVENIRRFVAEKDEEVFIIENEKMYKHRGRWEAERENLFTGYLFVDSQTPKEFDHRLHKKYRSLKLIRVNDVITPIFPREEALLRLLGGKDHIIRYSEGFRNGDEIIIENGPLKGFQGEIQKIDRHNRQATIKISLFGQDTIVTLGLGIIKSV